MIHIGICDDNNCVVDTMYQMIYDKCCSLKVSFRIEKSLNGEDLLLQMSQNGVFDLVFLDVSLGEENGIDIASKMKAVNPYCYIVFVSGYDCYYKDAFSVQPFQFLDKPIKESEVYGILDEIVKRVTDDKQVFSFEYKWKQYRIGLNQILYFISERRVIKLYTKDGLVYEFYGKLNDIENRFGKSGVFLRIHQSCLINMHYITILKKDCVVMQNRQMFSISVRKRQKVMEEYMCFIEKQ
ncbi:MAG: LytR/AlgR family response regulator transcription factor [Lachnospiraceae bacterium]